MSATGCRMNEDLLLEELRQAVISSTSMCIFKVNGQCWSRCSADKFCHNMALTKVKDLRLYDVGKKFDETINAS